MLVHTEQPSLDGCVEGNGGISATTLPPAVTARHDIKPKSTMTDNAHGSRGSYHIDTLYADPEITVLASSVATTVTKSVLHPLDTLKCRVQLLRTDITPPTQPYQRYQCYPSQQPPGLLRTRLRQLRHQYTGQWTPGHLYGGLPVKLLFYVPYQATYVLSYNCMQHTLQGMDSEGKDAAGHRTANYVWHTVAAAVFAEVVSAGLRVPMETMKMRIQSATAHGSFDALRQLWQQGFASCARLAVPQVLMHDIPYSIIQWVTYETLRPWTQQWKARLEEQKGGTELAATSSASKSFWALYGVELARTLLSGGLSGLLASVLTAPLDNIRTRVVVATVRNRHLTVTDVVRDTYQREGMRGFVRGGGMRVLWVTTNMACYFPLFESVRSLLLWRENEGRLTGASS
ncbi:mitochondrial carrier protein-like protein [Leishmania panamensis]|uniref:Mitochondrial carrier protein-like protein, putative n=2 Tax=Leishmania guyanensis species complex TaxID=38579 RepID=A0A088RR68_LEIPA|nr:mitochondrial carrier protein-like protein [Leishmania panamensis]AIN98602.1 mitochondrial carrier protein-like protein [Leishmania panamensis]